MEKAIKFLNRIKKYENIVVVFHNDADGIASAVLLKKLLKKKKAKIDLIFQPMPANKTLPRLIKSYFPHKIIFTDLAIDQQPGILNQIKGLCNILIIDHHQINKDMNKENIAHVNPRFERKNIFQSASYVVYKICSQIINMKKYLWIAGIGIVGDYNLKKSQDLVNEIKEQYNITDLHQSVMAKIAHMISATKATRELNLIEMANTIDSLQKPEDIRKNKNGLKMIQSYERIEPIIKKIIQDGTKKSSKKYILHQLETDLNIRSPVSTRLSDKFQDKFIGIYQMVGNKFKLSGRSQSGRWDVSRILQEASRGLRGMAGGHKKAAGATIHKDDFVIFLENLKRIIS